MADSISVGVGQVIRETPSTVSVIADGGPRMQAQNGIMQSSLNSLAVSRREVERSELDSQDRRAADRKKADRRAAEGQSNLNQAQRAAFEKALQSKLHTALEQRGPIPSEQGATNLTRGRAYSGMQGQAFGAFTAPVAPDAPEAEAAQQGGRLGNMPPSAFALLARPEPQPQPQQAKPQTGAPPQAPGQAQPPASNNVPARPLPGANGGGAPAPTLTTPPPVLFQPPQRQGAPVGPQPRPGTPSQSNVPAQVQPQVTAQVMPQVTPQVKAPTVQARFAGGPDLSPRVAPGTVQLPLTQPAASAPPPVAQLPSLPVQLQASTMAAAARSAAGAALGRPATLLSAGSPLTPVLLSSPKPASAVVMAGAAAGGPAAREQVLSQNPSAGDVEAPERGPMLSFVYDTKTQMLRAVDPDTVRGEQLLQGLVYGKPGAMFGQVSDGAGGVMYVPIVEDQVFVAAMQSAGAVAAVQTAPLTPEQARVQAEAEQGAPKETTLLFPVFGQPGQRFAQVQRNDPNNPLAPAAQIPIDEKDVVIGAHGEAEVKAPVLEYRVFGDPGARYRYVYEGSTAVGTVSVADEAVVTNAAGEAVTNVVGTKKDLDAPPNGLNKYEWTALPRAVVEPDYAGSKEFLAREHAFTYTPLSQPVPLGAAAAQVAGNTPDPSQPALPPAGSGTPAPNGPARDFVYDPVAEKMRYVDGPQAGSQKSFVFNAPDGKQYTYVSTSAGNMAFVPVEGEVPPAQVPTQQAAAAQPQPGLVATVGVDIDGDGGFEGKVDVPLDGRAVTVGADVDGDGVNDATVNVTAEGRVTIGVDQNGDGFNESLTVVAHDGTPSTEGIDKNGDGVNEGAVQVTIGRPAAAGATATPGAATPQAPANAQGSPQAAGMPPPPQAPVMPPPGPGTPPPNGPARDFVYDPVAEKMRYVDGPQAGSQKSFVFDAPDGKQYTYVATSAGNMAFMPVEGPVPPAPQAQAPATAAAAAPASGDVTVRVDIDANLSDEATLNVPADGRTVTVGIDTTGEGVNEGSLQVTVAPKTPVPVPGTSTEAPGAPTQSANPPPQGAVGTSGTPRVFHFSPDYAAGAGVLSVQPNGQGIPGYVTGEPGNYKAVITNSQGTQVFDISNDEAVAALLAQDAQAAQSTQTAQAAQTQAQAQAQANLPAAGGPVTLQVNTDEQGADEAVLNVPANGAPVTVGIDKTGDGVNEGGVQVTVGQPAAAAAAATPGVAPPQGPASAQDPSQQAVMPPAQPGLPAPNGPARDFVYDPVAEKMRYVDGPQAGSQKSFVFDAPDGKQYTYVCTSAGNMAFVPIEGEVPPAQQAAAGMPPAAGTLTRVGIDLEGDGITESTVDVPLDGRPVTVAVDVNADGVDDAVVNVSAEGAVTVNVDLDGNGSFETPSALPVNGSPVALGIDQNGARVGQGGAQVSATTVPNAPAGPTGTVTPAPSGQPAGVNGTMTNSQPAPAGQPAVPGTTPPVTVGVNIDETAAPEATLDVPADGRPVTIGIDKTGDGVNEGAVTVTVGQPTTAGQPTGQPAGTQPGATARGAGPNTQPAGMTSPVPSGTAGATGTLETAGATPSGQPPPVPGATPPVTVGVNIDETPAPEATVDVPADGRPVTIGIDKTGEGVNEGTVTVAVGQPTTAGQPIGHPAGTQPGATARGAAPNTQPAGATSPVPSGTTGATGTLDTAGATPNGQPPVPGTTPPVTVGVNIDETAAPEATLDVPADGRPVTIGIDKTGDGVYEGTVTVTVGQPTTVGHPTGQPAGTQPGSTARGAAPNTQPAGTTEPVPSGTTGTLDTAGATPSGQQPPVPGATPPVTVGVNIDETAAPEATLDVPADGRPVTIGIDKTGDGANEGTVTVTVGQPTTAGQPTGQPAGTQPGATARGAAPNTQPAGTIEPVPSGTTGTTGTLDTAGATPSGQPPVPGATPPVTVGVNIDETPAPEATVDVPADGRPVTIGIDKTGEGGNEGTVTVTVGQPTTAGQPTGQPAGTQPGSTARGAAPNTQPAGTTEPVPSGTTGTLDTAGATPSGQPPVPGATPPVTVGVNIDETPAPEATLDVPADGRPVTIGIDKTGDGANEGTVTVTVGQPTTAGQPAGTQPGATTRGAAPDTQSAGTQPTGTAEPVPSGTTGATGTLDTAGATPSGQPPAPGATPPVTVGVNIDETAAPEATVDVPADGRPVTIGIDKTGDGGNEGTVTVTVGQPTTAGQPTGQPAGTQPGSTARGAAPNTQPAGTTEPVPSGTTGTLDTAGATPSGQPPVPGATPPVTVGVNIDETPAPEATLDVPADGRPVTIGIDKTGDGANEGTVTVTVGQPTTAGQPAGTQPGATTRGAAPDTQSAGTQPTGTAEPVPSGTTGATGTLDTAGATPSGQPPAPGATPPVTVGVNIDETAAPEATVDVPADGRPVTIGIDKTGDGGNEGTVTVTVGQPTADTSPGVTARGAAPDTQPAGTTEPVPSGTADATGTFDTAGQEPTAAAAATPPVTVGVNTDETATPEATVDVPADGRPVTISIDKSGDGTTDGSVTVTVGQPTDLPQATVPSDPALAPTVNPLARSAPASDPAAEAPTLTVQGQDPVAVPADGTPVRATLDTGSNGTADGSVEVRVDDAAIDAPIDAPIPAAVAPTERPLAAADMSTQSTPAAIAQDAPQAKALGVDPSVQRTAAAQPDLQSGSTVRSFDAEPEPAPVVQPVSTTAPVVQPAATTAPAELPEGVKATLVTPVNIVEPRALAKAASATTRSDSSATDADSDAADATSLAPRMAPMGLTSARSGMGSASDDTGSDAEEGPDFDTGWGDNGDVTPPPTVTPAVLPTPQASTVSRNDHAVDSTSRTEGNRVASVRQAPEQPIGPAPTSQAFFGSGSGGQSGGGSHGGNPQAQRDHSDSFSTGGTGSAPRPTLDSAHGTAGSHTAGPAANTPGPQPHDTRPGGPVRGFVEEVPLSERGRNDLVFDDEHAAGTGPQGKLIGTPQIFMNTPPPPLESDTSDGEAPPPPPDQQGGGNQLFNQAAGSAYAMMGRTLQEQPTVQRFDVLNPSTTCMTHIIIQPLASGKMKVTLGANAEQSKVLYEQLEHLQALLGLRSVSYVDIEETVKGDEENESPEALAT